MDSKKEHVTVMRGTETDNNVDVDIDVHLDKGLEVLNAYDGDEQWAEEEENKLRRKIDYKLMPILCFTYGLQYYDKAMLGQAVSLMAVQGRRCMVSMKPNMNRNANPQSRHYSD